LGWMLYLMAASIFAFGPTAMAAADPSAYRSAAVRLVVLVSVGLFVLWPLLRLSQVWPKTPIRAFVTDAAVLLCPSMLLIWPHVILAWWPVEVAAALSALLLGWAGVVGGLLVGLALGGQSGSTWIRSAALFGWLGLVLLAPGVFLALGFGGGLAAEPGAVFGGESWMVSPITGVYEVARDRAWSGRPAQVSVEHWRSIAVVWIGVGVTWAWAGARGRVRGVSADAARA